tara:strand:- start:395 stop:676 length:282 start_codon:yes stop_codon:yes gene_type:complete
VEVVVRAIGKGLADVEDDVVGGCFGKFWDWSAVRAEKGRWGARAGEFINGAFSHDELLHIVGHISLRSEQATFFTGPAPVLVKNSNVLVLGTA